MKQAEAFAPFGRDFGEDIGIIVYCLHLMRKVFIVEVVYIVFHVTGLAFNRYPSVRIRALPLSAPPFKEAQLVIRVPIAMINPPSQIETAPWEKEAYRIIRITNGIMDFLNKLRRQPFVSI